MTNKTNNKIKTFAVYLTKDEKEKALSYFQGSEYNTITDFIYSFSVNQKHFINDGERLSIYRRKRTERLVARLTPEQSNNIKKLSDEYFITESDYVRRRILQYHIEVASPLSARDEFDQTIEKLKAILRMHYKNTFGKYASKTKALLLYISNSDFKDKIHPDNYLHIKEVSSELAHNARNRIETIEPLAELINLIK